MQLFKRASFFLLTLALGLAMITPALHAFSFSQPLDIDLSKINAQVKTTGKYAAIAAPLAFLAYCIFSFYCKQPSTTFKARHSWRYKDLKTRSIKNIDDLREQIRYAMRNTYWIIEDGIIGIPGNASNSVRIDPETGKVSAKKFSNPAGIFGWIHAYLNPLKKTLAFPGKVVDFCWDTTKFAATGFLLYILWKNKGQLTKEKLDILCEAVGKRFNTLLTTDGLEEKLKTII